MALVDHLEPLVLENLVSHSEVACTYSIVHDAAGSTCLELDTYGSPERKLTGKKSQSIRLSPNAINQLRDILDRPEFGVCSDRVQ